MLKSMWGWARQGSGVIYPWDIIFVLRVILYLEGNGLSHEKQTVALSSVLAAIFLTGMKIVIGIYTGSLGILSEAAHSALDLGAAVITFFAVKISDKPADINHNYGHGKVESFSALIETLLLLVTCIWIIREAIQKLFFGGTLEISGSGWGIAVMLVSIIVDISRSRALKRAAQKYGSQALEADALHFGTDVWSSSVVIVGLIFVSLGDYLKLPFLHYADPITALGVCGIVIYVSLALGKRTIDVLLDAAPAGMPENIARIAQSVEGIQEVESVRIRPSGPTFFIDLQVGISKNESHRVVHALVENIQQQVQKEYPNSDVTVSTYPISPLEKEDREVYHTVKTIVDRFPKCTNIHNIHVFEISGKKRLAIHLEVKENLSLQESHNLSHEIGNLVQLSFADVEEVSVNFEYVKQQNIVAEDITAASQTLISEIDTLINRVPEKLNCHDVRVYRQGEKLTLFLHCELSGNYGTETIEKISNGISQRIRKLVSNVDDVFIHVEPMS